MSKPVKAQEGEPKIMINRHQGESRSFVEKLSDEVGIHMMLIPEGSFNMGSPDDEEGRRNSESPIHLVKVPSFFMGKYPVTQAQWKAVAALPQVNCEIDPNPSYFKGADRPVEQVSWYEAVEFCERLTQHTGRPYRLPSEAEWEYACRAGTTTPFNFGETISTDLANYCGEDRTIYGTLYKGSYGDGSNGIYRGQTTEVGSFPANAFGLHDMHGNVWEWCADHWHDSYNDAPNDGSAWLDENDNHRRVLRGGSWNDLPRNCRSACRVSYNAADLRSFTVGFRVVCAAARTL